MSLLQLEVSTPADGWAATTASVVAECSEFSTYARGHAARKLGYLDLDYVNHPDLDPHLDPDLDRFFLSLSPHPYSCTKAPPILLHSRRANQHFI